MKRTRLNIQAKIFKHLDRLTEWYYAGTTRPITAQLDPSNRCNNKCSFCIYNYMKDKQEQLEYKTMVSILDQMKELGIKAINISGGGEPLMNKRTPDIIQYANDIGLQVGFITNGQLINKNTANAIVKSCKWCRISLSATTRKTFQQIRGVDGFDKALAGMDYLIEARAKVGSDINLGLHWVYTKKDSWNNLESFLENYRQYDNIDYFQIIPKQSRSTKELSAQIDMIPHVQVLQKQFGKIIVSKVDDLTAKDFGRTYSQCHGLHFFLMLGADGIVYPCCHLLGIGKYAIGSIYENTLKDIWYSNRRVNLSKEIDVNECLPLCKHHVLNKLLDNIRQPIKDKNFL